MLRRRGRAQHTESESGETYGVQARVPASFDNEFEAYLAGAYVDWLLARTSPSRRGHGSTSSRAAPSTNSASCHAASTTRRVADRTSRSGGS